MSNSPLATPEKKLTSLKRVASLPDTATLAEQGLPAAAVIDGRTALDETLTLSMHRFPTGQAAAPGVFALAESNSVQVIVDDPLGTSFDIEVDANAQELDLYFFVFRTTLVGQRSERHPGRAGRRHELLDFAALAHPEDGAQRLMPPHQRIDTGAQRADVQLAAQVHRASDVIGGAGRVELP